MRKEKKYEGSQAFGREQEVAGARWSAVSLPPPAVHPGNGPGTAEGLSKHQDREVLLYS